VRDLILTAEAYGSGSRERFGGALAGGHGCSPPPSSGSAKGSRAVVADPDDNRSKLALIGEMKAQLMSGERQSLDADAQ
jgi:hypothetical protein